MEFNHTSVLLTETIENLNIRPDGIYVVGRIRMIILIWRLSLLSVP